jgi:DNA-binding transcriptional ArsR family regulator
MAGRAPHLIVSGGKSPKQRIWEAMRILAQGFDVHDIARRSDQMPNEIVRYIDALKKAGIVETVVDDYRKGQARLYKLAKDEGAEHPRLNSKGERTYDHLATENMWRSLRILGGNVTVRDVVSAASVGTVSLTATKVRQYLNALSEAGYLAKTPGDTAMGIPTFYCLIPGKDTGPRPPEIRQLESLQVYDPNLNRLIYTKTTGTPGSDRSLIEPGIDLARTRELLGEWLTLAKTAKGPVSLPADLVQRTQLELASQEESGGLQ